MSLNKNKLIEELRKFMDIDYSDFDQFPEGEEEAKEALANAVYLYSEKVSPTSGTASDAKSKMIVGLMNMSKPDQAVTIIKSAINIYANALGMGMAAGGFTQLTPPPSGLPALESITVEDNKTSADAASEVADIIDNWFVSWTATNSATKEVKKWS